MSKEAGFDQNITVFSPEGHLYQVEYAYQAVKTAGLTSLAIRCSDGVVLISQLPSIDRLTDSSKTTFIEKINDDTCVMITGRSADGKRMLNRVRSESVEFRNKWGYVCPCETLCTIMADIAQVYTQEAWMRPCGIVLTFAGWDPVKKTPSLWKTDPAGTCCAYRATAAGMKENDISDILSLKVKNWYAEEPINPDDDMMGRTKLPTCKEGCKVGMKALQTVISNTLTGDDIEVALMGENGLVRLTPEEVDRMLAEVATED